MRKGERISVRLRRREEGRGVKEERGHAMVSRNLVPRLHSLIFLHLVGKAGEWSLGMRLVSCTLSLIPSLHSISPKINVIVSGGGGGNLAAKIITFAVVHQNPCALI